MRHLAGILAALLVTGCGSDGFDISPYVEGGRAPVVARVSVASFGAVSGGVFDNACAFQNALDSALTTGGVHIEVPPGVWRITKSLRGYSNTTISGPRSAVLWFDTLDFGSSSGSVADFDEYQNAAINFTSGSYAVKTGDRSYTLDGPCASSGPFRNCWVRGITIASNANYGDAFAIHHKGVWLHGCENSGVTDCHVTGFAGEAVYAAEYGRGILFSQNSVENCAHNAFNFNGRIHDSVIANNTAFRVGQPIEATGWNNSISGNVFDTYCVNGILLGEDTLGYEVSATVSGNRLTGFAGDPTLHTPILVQPGASQSRDIVIANNVIRGTMRWGISVTNRVSGGGFVTVSGNVIREEGSTQSIGGGITVEGPCDMILITGNALTFSTDHSYAAIGVAAAGSHCIVTNNVIQSPLSFRGCPSLYADCIQLPYPVSSGALVVANFLNGVLIP